MLPVATCYCNLLSLKYYVKQYTSSVKIPIKKPFLQESQSHRQMQKCISLQIHKEDNIGLPFIYTCCLLLK